jgi:transposase-like protein
MRYPASEKLEIIRLVERSHLPTKRTLDMLGIPRTTFYRWYDRYIALGEAGLEDQPSHPGRVWNRIPDAVRRQIVDLALEEPELSPRELAVRFTDTQRYFVSEASVYRLLIAHEGSESRCGATARPDSRAGCGERQPERTLLGLLATMPVLSPSLIIVGKNRKIRPEPDREIAFARASGGGNGTDVEPSPAVTASATHGRALRYAEGTPRGLLHHVLGHCPAYRKCSKISQN